MKKRKSLWLLQVLFLALVAPAVMVHVSVQAAEPGATTEATRQSNVAVLNDLPFRDKQDFADAARGLVAVIRNPEGQIVWDMNQYQFLNGDTPLETINPSLRRQATLNNFHGLFKVADRIYQMRQISYEGSIGRLSELMSMLDEFDLWFNIVTP
jgi:alkyl sulfatase BDS1-like metallo-beta-lactamase superfamily hydrolase